VGERAPADDQDPAVAATGGTRCQYGEAPGRGLAQWEKEVGPTQLNSVVSDLNQNFQRT
jgi:hypothetical protein